MRANTAMMLATMLRQPGHAAMVGCARRAMAMLDEEISVTSKVDAATQLLQYYDYTGDLETLVAVVAPEKEVEEAPVPGAAAAAAPGAAAPAAAGAAAPAADAKKADAKKDDKKDEKKK